MSPLPARATLFALMLGGLLTVVCYFFVDRPVARYVHNHQLNNFQPFLRLASPSPTGPKWSPFTHFKPLLWLTFPPPIVQTWSPLIVSGLLAWRVFGRWSSWQLVLLTACLSLIVADQFRESLGQLCGRYWPETWHDNNPSYLGTGTYGFDPFRPASDAGSFPSGHAARIAGFLGVLWIALPRRRWLYAAIALPMLIALVGMNYHFVGDVVAGVTLGWIVAMNAAALAGLCNNQTTSSAV